MDLSRIRFRLAGWNLLVFGLVLAVTLGTAAFGEVRATDAAVDHELREAAAREAARFERRELRERRPESKDDDDGDEHERREHGGEARHDEPDEDDHASADADLFVLSVGMSGGAVRSNKTPPAGLPDFAALDAALAGRESEGDRTVAGAPVRLLTVPVLHAGRVVGAVQVGKVVAESRGAVSRTIVILLVTGVAGLVLSAVGSAFLAGRAMRPIGDALERQRRFLADASHELRTPVAVVRARAELLQREGEGLSPAARDELVQLHRDAEELTGLLEDLLDLARLDAGRAEIAAEPVALGDVAEEVAAQLAPLATERSVELCARAEPIFASADLARVRQVLRALADNALKHTPAGGRVELSVTRDGDRARVRVVDEGEGIAPADLDKVKDRFFRADEARTRAAGSRKGAGLGLSIATELVRRMRGELTIASTPGKGTTVTVDLPLAAPP